MTERSAKHRFLQPENLMLSEVLEVILEQLDFG